MTTLTAHRVQKDSFFKHSPDAPLEPDEQARFTGLRYYPENPALCLTVAVEEFATPETVEMQTSTGTQRAYQRWGRFTFTVEGVSATLTVYLAHDEYFVPFMDATSGNETYGAGRYLELEALRDGRFRADFNLAYNPWCAYSPYYSCPVPPFENRLAVPIRAGEMDYPHTVD